MIEAVIFDFDGVIGDTMKDNCLAWQNAFAHYGFEMNETEYYRLEGMGRYQIAEHFITNYNLNPEIKKEVAALKEENYKKNNRFKIYDHVFEIFEYLKSKNILTAIVTGASRERISEHLDKKIASQINALITADDVTNTKPNPEPYLKAIQKLNKPADKCLVIENAILGLESAIKAGCKAYALETTLSKEDLNQAEQVFANHKELLTKFESQF
ncbi:MAG: HAD family phosphatase [Sphingobacteriaceae bacterium]|nr:HAD family phosphatase [Sphingobacteriaceae bacterium]